MPATNPRHIVFVRLPFPELGLLPFKPQQVWHSKNVWWYIHINKYIYIYIYTYTHIYEHTKKCALICMQIFKLYNYYLYQNVIILLPEGIYTHYLLHLPTDRATRNTPEPYDWCGPRILTSFLKPWRGSVATGLWFSSESVVQQLASCAAAGLSFNSRGVV